MTIETENVKMDLRASKAIKRAEPSGVDFDWDNIGKSADIYKADDKERFEKMYDQTLSSVVEHDVLNGTIIGMTSKEAVVNIGFKSDGLIPLSEFRHMPDLKIGDEVEVYVETQEDKNGQLILSHKKARALNHGSV
jgi:small subunit ribosomal protein S1